MSDGAFTNTAGQARNHTDGTRHHIPADLEGNGSGDPVIRLGQVRVERATSCSKRSVRRAAARWL